MKCAVHSDVDATGYCRNCGKAMCGSCTRPVRDVLYCEDCLAQVMGHAPQPAQAPPPPLEYAPATAAPAPAPRKSVSSPGVAFVLGLFPGLGAVYNGEYNKALIFIVIFATMIMGLASDMDGGLKAFLAILLAGFICYMPFDSMRVARAKNLGQTPADPLEDWSKNRPLGPIILIAVGLLFLLNNFHVFDFFHITQFWPLVLIGVGILMFRKRLGGN